MNVISTVDNWIWFSTHEATAASEVNDSRNDGGSLGNFSESFDRLEAIAPSGTALHGQDAFGVNYPNSGQCFVSAWVLGL